MPTPEALGKMAWCLTYGTQSVQKYVGFDSLDRQAGWHAVISRAQSLSMREARSADTVSRGLRSKRISRGRKQDTGALNIAVFIRPGGR
jgi:hypothetical protein